MSDIIDAWIKRNYAHDVTFDLAPQLQGLIAAAVQEEREACEQIALSANVRHGITRSEIATGDQVAASIAAAIHSRKNGSK